MSKKTTLVLCSLLLFSRLFASHVVGGEIRYAYNGTNYTVTFIGYRDCSGLAFGTTQSVSFISSSCSYSFTRSLPLVNTDNNAGMYCPSLGVTCGSTSSYPMFSIYTYSDTVSLPPCSDWTISATTSTLNSSITNILNPGSQNMYVEAFLNNSTALNSNPVIANLPPFVIGLNYFSTTSIQATDPDGDSISYQMIMPEGAASTNLIWPGPGYSLSTPMGSGSYAAINQGQAYLELSGPSVSRNLLAMRTYEYRNGTMVGYSTREWTTIPLTGAGVKVPLPNGNTYHYITHPGQTQTITMNYSDSTSADSVFVGFDSTNSFGYTITSTPGLGSGSGTISWTTPTGINPATTPYFFIYVPVRNNACPLAGRSTNTIMVSVTQPSPTDSVWAGDADDDYAVTMYDPLAIAIAYGQTGATRLGASTSWIAQYCTPWTNSFVLTGVNMKHADCNGDGTVNSTDLAAVSANYGMTHPKGEPVRAKVSGVPNLYFDLTGIVFTPGANVSVPIKFGDAVTAASNIYGLAASVEINGAVTLTTAPTITYATSWIGTAANTLNFSKNISNNHIDWAYARTNQTNVSGNGTIATLNFTVPATATAGQQMVFHFSMPRVINNTGTILTNYNTIDSTATITAPAIISNIQNPLQYATVVPNPSASYSELHLSLSAPSALQIKVTDLMGKTVWQQSQSAGTGAQSIILPSAQIVPGMYIVYIQGEGWQNKEILKWVKQ